MPVKEADPNAKSLEAAFGEAMGAPARPKDPPPPKEIDPEAPHGRDENGVPLEPYGRTKENKIRRSPAGRPAKDDQARTGPAQPAAAAGKGKDDGKPAEALAAPGQYAKQLSDTADGLWFAMSAVAKAAPGIPLIGASLVKRNVPERLSAQAHIWHSTSDRAVAAIDLAAQHNASAARFARKLEGGDITWMITCVSLVAPILTLSGMVWAKDADAQLTAAEQPMLKELAASNDAAMDQAIAIMTANAQQAEIAAMNGQAQEAA